MNYVIKNNRPLLYYLNLRHAVIWLGKLYTIIKAGGSRVIIVPADCIPETDPTTGRLCKNYAKLLED